MMTSHPFTGTLGSILEQLRVVNKALNRPALDLENNEDLTSLGLLLWLSNDLATGLLDSIKEILRKRAVAVRGGLPGSITFGAPEGVCTVTVQGTEIKVRKDMIHDLRASLGEDLFCSLFEMETVFKPRSGFSELASTLTPKQQQEIGRAVDMQIRTPRVAFTTSK